MTAYTTAIGFNKGTAAPGYHDGRFAFSSVKLDFEKIVADRVTAGATALAAADTIQVLSLPANFLILQGGMEVTEAEATNTTATFDLGFTGASPAAANVFGNDVACTAGATATGLAAPLLITTADTLDLLLNTAVCTNAVVYVWVAGVFVDFP